MAAQCVRAMRILFCTGNEGKFTEAVHAIDHLSGGGVKARRITACAHAIRVGAARSADRLLRRR